MTMSRHIMMFAIGVLVFLFGCTSASNAGRSMSGSFATCAKADLGQVIADTATTLLGSVAAIIAKDNPELEANLTTLATDVGADAVKCAIAAVDGVIMAPRTTQSTLERPQGLSRAMSWSAAK